MQLHCIPLGASLSLFGALALGALAAPTSNQNQQGQDLGEQVAALAESALVSDAVGGLSIVITMGGETLVSMGAGQAGCDPESADERTRFAAGGCFDLFLALSAVRLCERGELDLETPVSDILDDFAFADEGLTVGHLLAHTSGLAQLSNLPQVSSPTAEEPEDVEQALLARLGQLPLTSSPGECQEFSSGGVLVLGLVLEAVSGAQIKDLIEAEVVEAFGLESTGFSPGNDARFQRFMGSELASTEPQALPFEADALRTTASDLARLANAMNSAEFEGALDLLKTPVVVYGKPAAFAQGVISGEMEEHEFFSFGGNSESCAIQCVVYPDIELAISICASPGEAPVEGLGRRIARLLYNLPEPGILDLPLPEGADKTYAGQFMVGCNFYFLSIQGQRLQVSLPDRRSFELLYQGEHVFVSTEDSDVRFLFEVIDEVAVEFTLEEHGARSTGKRIQ